MAASGRHKMSSALFICVCSSSVFVYLFICLINSETFLRPVKDAAGRLSGGQGDRGTTERTWGRGLSGSMSE